MSQMASFYEKYKNTQEGVLKLFVYEQQLMLAQQYTE